MNIIFDEMDNHEGIDSQMLNSAAEAVLELENITNSDVEISLSFVEPEEIKQYNSQFRGVDNVTDVLSFPQYQGAEDVPTEGYAPIGDVVICMQRAQEQAQEFGHSLAREVVYLFVHSLFHLLGYDHMEEDDKAVMRKQEELVMKHIGLERE